MMGNELKDSIICREHGVLEIKIRGRGHYEFMQLKFCPFCGKETVPK